MVYQTIAKNYLAIMPNDLPNIRIFL